MSPRSGATARSGSSTTRRTPPDILLVPLPGHTRGHCAVAVQQPERWLLHAGDAYFFHGELDLRRPRCPRPVALHQRLVAENHGQRLMQLERLRDLRRADPRLIRIFSSHDAYEFAQLGAESVSPLR
jgi:glyoxylase-like metal-dependent hydrolase (beta-lactamase superfamily II)